MTSLETWTVPARLRIGVGETYDFLFTPDREGELRLIVSAQFPTETGESRFERSWRIGR